MGYPCPVNQKGPLGFIAERVFFMLSQFQPAGIMLAGG
jgi:hypothetical protein